MLAYSLTGDSHRPTCHSVPALSLAHQLRIIRTMRDYSDAEECREKANRIVAALDIGLQNRYKQLHTKLKNCYRGNISGAVDFTTHGERLWVKRSDKTLSGAKSYAKLE